MSVRNILCIGAGYVGGPTMAMIAASCPELRVEVTDSNPERLAAWNGDELPIYEPGLKEIVLKVRNRNLFFVDDPVPAIKKADAIFISVNTPTKTFGEGAGFASDLQYCESAARLILEHADSPKIVVEKSTLPVRCAESIDRVLNAGERPFRFEVISNPEFLSEGTAIADLRNPDRVLIGAMNTLDGKRAAEDIAGIYRHWVSEEKIKFTNVWSSELSKLAANAFLAQRVSSINSLCRLCEATGADIREVAGIVGSDRRIGGRFLEAGVGFGGSCFRKDLLNLVYLCRRYGLETEAAYWEGVLRINDQSQLAFVERMQRAMFDTLAGKRIAVFGAAFKPDSGDVRESPALNVVRRLLSEHAEIALCDPKALPAARKALDGDAGSVSFEPDPYAAAAGAHALAVLTNWKEFQELDYSRIYAGMKKPAFLFDGRNALDRDEMYKIGFNVHPIGMDAMSHI